MSVRKGAAAGGGEEEPKKRRLYFKCPACGRRYVLTRCFCDCGRWLPVETYATDGEAEIDGEVNIEDPNYTPCCPRCGERCARCRGFGVVKSYGPDKGGKFFGGAACSYRKNDARCACCQNLVRGKIRCREPYSPGGVSPAGEPFERGETIRGGRAGNRG
jgi:hypothetical protein